MVLYQKGSLILPGSYLGTLEIAAVVGLEAASHSS